jgi:prepilin-type N-terminal cleavage/methylation domain-containing protein
MKYLTHTNAHHTDSGFTLLELLLVVGMLAMLISYIGFSMFAGLSKGRDTRRLQDVNDFQKALQLTLITDKKYPVYPTEIEINGTDAINTLLLGRADLLAAIKDPVNDSTFKYWYKSSAGGTTYEIRFCQENDSSIKTLAKGCTNKMTP